MNNSGGERVLRVSGLCHRYGDRFALGGVDLEVPRNSIFGLVGPNGAGKTTLFSLIAGYIGVQEGTIEVLGGHRPGHPSLLGRVSILPQDAAFERNVTIFDQLVFMRQLDGINRLAARKEAAAALCAVDLEEISARGAVVLSHGMVKRLGVAQAILGQPELVLLDEPTSGLDPANARRVRDLIRGLKSRATVIVSSHNLLELEGIVDEVAIIDHGRILACGHIDEVTRLDRRLVLRFGRDLTADEVQILSVIEGVEGVEADDLEECGEVTIALAASVGESAATVQRILRSVVDEELPLREMREGSSLEDAFLRITGGKGGS
ncbi:MAG TPA: ABC transporter ATP-binding protein [Planctomycetes bacterium]|nr:ABC transporter ATP-binding protein [Planctomycetota bacterium]HIN81159.1 ABC transporter ATP-binding protein [Planctomycetota bacterium]